MNNKIIPIIAAVVVVVIVAAAAVVVLNGGNNKDSAQADAVDMANGFASAYDGDYDVTFSLVKTSDKIAEAAAEGPNSMVSKIFVSYTICDDNAKAKEYFDTQKATLSTKAGTSAMGALFYYAIEEKGSFDDGYGIYGDATGGMMGTWVLVKYAAVCGNVYVNSVFFVDEKNYADTDFKSVITAEYNAIKKPVEPTLKDMAQSFAYTCPDTFKADFVVSATDDGAQAVSEGTGMLKNLGLVIKQFDSESKAKEYFDTQKTTFSSKAGTSPMEGLKYYAIEKTGSSTDSYGYYGDATGGVMGTWVSIHFSGYTGNIAFDAVFYVSEKNYADVDFSTAVSAIDAALSL